MSQQETTNAVKEFFHNPATAKAMVDLVVRKKPVGWSRRSNAPYYKEFYALGFKDEVDKMLLDRQDRVFRYDNFPHHSKETLYLRVNQSLRYLLDYMDDDQKTYSKWNEMTAITRERGLGVRMSFRPEFRNSSIGTFTAVAVGAKSDIPAWKQKVDDFLENATPEDKPLHLERLCLTTEQLIDLKNSLLGIDNVMSSVTAQEIKIIKTS